MLETLSREWFSSVLRSTVSDFSSEVIGADSGTTANIQRAYLTYAVGAVGPPSVIIKSPAVEPETRARFISVGAYGAEVLFFTEMAARSRVRTPFVYHAEINKDGDDFVLVLEDLANLRQGQVDVPCDLETAELVLVEIAKLHAAWWNGAFPAKSRPALASRQVTILDELLHDFLVLHGDLVPQHLVPWLSELSDEANRHLSRLMGPPFTCYQNDLKLDNVFFNDISKASSPVFIDWGAWRRGPGAYDVASFLSENLTPISYAKFGADLLTSYLESLHAEGVRDYDFDTLREDVRLQTLACVMRHVIVGAREIPREGQRANYRARGKRFFEMVDVLLER